MSAASGDELDEVDPGAPLSEPHANAPTNMEAKTTDDDRSRWLIRNQYHARPKVR